MLLEFFLKNIFSKLNYIILATGKSFLIDCIRQHVMVKFKDQAYDGWLAVILAPTGMAAFNINGIKIHRCF